jgi:hypothetical protein
LNVIQSGTGTGHAGCADAGQIRAKVNDRERYLIGTPFAFSGAEVGIMNVRLLGFRTLACGCVIGRYRELATSRELTYVEEKGTQCDAQGHRRNHTVSAERLASAATLISAKAS